VTPLRLAVVGAGPMGRLHARAIARRSERIGDCVLGYVVDRNLSRSESVAEEFGGQAVESLDGCWGEVDGAVVAVPTRSHGDVTRALLEHAVDVLVEKPMCATLTEAREVARLALDHGRILAVGHVEWFNATLRDAVRRAGTPRRIEVVRLNPRTDRGLDIDVVQDFMLHDLDWVGRIVRDDLVDVEASGRMVVNRQLDEAEADLLFASGIRARLRVSRVHSQRTRSVRIEGSDATVDVDLLEHPEAGAHEPTKARNDGIEPLDAEWADFLDACRSRKTPENDAAVGIAAIEMVERVRAAIAQRTPRGGGES